MPLALVVDRAYEDDETRDMARALGFTPVVPPRQTRREPWAYDRQLYKLNAATKSNACSAA